MNNIRLYITLIMMAVGLMLVVDKINSQVVNSLYFLENTPMNARMNPAMAPKYSGFGIGLSNLSLYIHSDIAADEMFYPGSNGKLNFFMNSDIDKSAFLTNLKDISSLNMSTNLDLFSLGIRIKKNYFSVHSGIIVDAGLGVPKDIFRLLVLGIDKEATVNTFDMSSLNLEAMVYSKTGVSYSTQIGKLIAVGVGINRLQGFINASMGFDQFKIDASETKLDITSKGYFQIAGPEEILLKYSEEGYFNGVGNGLNMSSSGDYSETINSLSKVGSGYSFDLGITVKPLNFLTVSASLTDIGSIKWNRDYIQKATSNGSFTYDSADFDEMMNNNGNDTNPNGGNQFKEQLQELVRFRKVTNVEAYKSNLTTKLNIAAELGILKNHITFGVLSQTGFTEDGKYSDLMISANLKPGSFFQTALTYSLLHGKTNSFGVAVNSKLLFFNVFLAADYIPLKYTNGLPGNSYYNLQTGLNFMF